jgi:hypothetical protein
LALGGARCFAEVVLCRTGPAKHSAERVEVVVPESCLTVQLFLREAGYRATEVLHGDYGTEDGYRMVKQG